MTIETSGEAPPAQFTFLCDLYKRMYSASDMVDTEDGPVRVYKGYLTKLIMDDMGLPVPYYSNLTQALKSMRCATQLRRGGGSSASEWRLLSEPTRAAYDKFVEATGTKSRSKTAIVTSQIADLTRRVTALEDALGEMMEAIRG